jgi:hypothetical protein
MEKKKIELVQNGDIIVGKILNDNKKGNFEHLKDNAFKIENDEFDITFYNADEIKNDEKMNGFIKRLNDLVYNYMTVDLNEIKQSEK